MLETTTPSPRRAHAPRGGALRGQARDRRPGRDARAPARRAAGRRPRAARGRPRPGEDADRQTLAAGRRRQVHPRAVHARPGPRRPRRHARAQRPDDGELRRRARPGLRQPPPRRRDQPRARPRCSPRCSRSCRSSQVTIGGTTYPLPTPFLVLATQNPIESEGTYPLPEAQVDRFLFKLLVDYPTAGRGGRGRRPRRWRGPVVVEKRLDAQRPRGAPPDGRARSSSTATSWATPSRSPTPRAARPSTGSRTSRASSSTAPARAGRSASSRPARRSRCCAAATTWSPTDVADLAPDVLRHRLVLSYDALADGVTADDVARPRRPDEAGAAGPRRREPAPRQRRERTSPRHEPPGRCRGRSASHVPPGRQGPGAAAGRRRSTRSTWPSPRGGRRAARRPPRPGVGAGTELAQLRPYEPGDDVRQLDPAASARTVIPHVRQHVPERALTTWIALDVSASMAFGTADAAEVRRGRGRGAVVLAAWPCAAAGRVASLTCGAPVVRLLPPRGGRGALARHPPRARRAAGRGRRRRPTAWATPRAGPRPVAPAAPGPRTRA